MATTKNTADLLAQAAATLADNTTQQISPQDSREMAENNAVSAFNKITDTALVGLKQHNVLPTYESGQGCINGGQVYISNKITGPGAFVGADWDLYAALSAADKAKIDFISITQAVDLDTVESDVTANNAKLTADSTNVDAAGAVMNTDATTAAMSFVIDEDNMVSDSDTKVPTQQSVKAYVDTTTASAKAYKGGYDANTNTPDLDTTPIAGIEAGDVYDVTAAGSFFGSVDLEIGDTITANQASPTTAAHWVVTQANLTPASIKTQYESNADTNAYTDAEVTKVGFISVTQAVDLDSIESDVTANNAKVTNVTTNLSEGTATNTSVDVNSSDGSNATLAAASTSRAGVMTKAKFDEVTANNAKVTNVSTNLSHLADTVQIVVNSSDGTNTTLVGATSLLAGLLTAAKFDEIGVNNAKVTFPEAPNDGTQYARKNLGWEAVAGSNLYTADGTVTADRTITGGGYTVDFDGVNELQAKSSNSAFSGQSVFRLSNSTAGIMLVKSSGEIQSTPAAANFNLNLKAPNGTDSIKFFTTNSDAYFNLYDTGVRKVAINASANSFMDANLIIGATAGSSLAKLHVKGTGATSATSALLVTNNAGTARLDIRDDGRMYHRGGGYSYNGSLYTTFRSQTANYLHGGFFFLRSDDKPLFTIANSGNIGLNTDPVSYAQFISVLEPTATRLFDCNDSTGSPAIKHRYSSIKGTNGNVWQFGYEDLAAAPLAAAAYFGIRGSDANGAALEIKSGIDPTSTALKNGTIWNDGTSFIFRNGAVNVKIHQETGVSAMTNLTAPANLDADTVTVAELADIVGNLIGKLRAHGLVAD